MVRFFWLAGKDEGGGARLYGPFDAESDGSNVLVPVEGTSGNGLPVV